jgi:hypothetical protein
VELSGRGPRDLVRRRRRDGLAHAILAPAPAEGVRRYAWRTLAGAWLVITLWFLAGGKWLALPSVALAPPMFVSALEWLARGRLTAPEGVRRRALLVGAGLVGSGAVVLVPVAWLAGALAIVATIGLMRLLATPHPPALAIALIAQILDTSPPLTFTLAVAAGAGALYLGVYALGRLPPMARVPHARPAVARAGVTRRDAWPRTSASTA